MGQSLVKNYVHIVFSTKERQPFIDDTIEHDLHNYIGGICKGLECWPVKIGGYVDHLHILCMLSKKIAMMKLLEEVKSHSSGWVKTVSDRYSNFFWQGGYGAFSVSRWDVDMVKRYIERQHEHHKGQTFKEEFLGILKQHEVEYDERYLWD